MHGAISDGWEVAYFTSDRLAQDLGRQMKSIGLALPACAHEHKLSVHTINRASSGEATGSPIDDLVSEIESLPASCGLVVIDGITEISMVSEPRAVMGFSPHSNNCALRGGLSSSSPNPRLSIQAC